MAANPKGMTIPEFRAAYRISVKRWSAMLRKDDAPAMIIDGRTKLITFAAAQAWQEAEGRRVVESLNFWAGSNAGDPASGES